MLSHLSLVATPRTPANAPGPIQTWQASSSWIQVATRDAYDSAVDLDSLSELRWFVELYGESRQVTLTHSLPLPSDGAFSELRQAANSQSSPGADTADGATPTAPDGSATVEDAAEEEISWRAPCIELNIGQPRAHSTHPLLHTPSAHSLCPLLCSDCRPPQVAG